MELHHVHPDKLLGDKGYDSDDIRSDFADCGIQPVIPPRLNRKTPIEYDRETSGATSSSGRQSSQAIPPHRDPVETARAYLSMLCIAAAKLWIKTINTD
jgi:hypothetical protein